MNEYLEDLIITAKQLCKNLEDYATKELKQCEELSNEFEKMSWDVHCMIEEMKLIQIYKELDVVNANEFQIKKVG